MDAAIQFYIGFNQKDLDDFVNRFGQASKEIQRFSKNATNALTSLSLVAQDLPFGFIGIQNNLPRVIQTFGELQKETGGAIPALKSLGASLIGPAGLFFAFSAITSAITFAVQEYGSLGNAIDALIGTQSQYNKELLDAIKIYDKYNESKKTNSQIIGEENINVSGDVERVRTLTEIIINQNKSYDERATALNNLKSINKEFFGNLDLEKSKFEDLKIAIDSYISSIEQAAISKGFEKAYSEANLQLFKQQEILTKLRNERDAIAAKPIKTRGKAEIADTRELDAANKRFLEQRTLVENLSVEVAKYKQQLNLSIKKENEIKAPIEAANRELLKQEEAAKKASKALEQLRKAKEEQYFGLRDIRELRDPKFRLPLPELELPKKINSKEYIEPFFKEFRKISDQYNLRPLIDVLFPEDKYEKSLSKLKKLGDETALSTEKIKEAILINILSSQIYDGIEPTYDNIERVIAEFIDNTNNKLAELEIKDAISNFKTNIDSLGEVYKLTFSSLVEKNKELAQSIQGYLYQPLESLFDILLEKGKKNWKDFGNVIISILKRIAAQLIATGIAKGIANLIAPGLGSISTGALGAFLDQSPFSANFGNVQGGLALTGQVVFRQSGSDLVGVLNRTNATINRVG